MAKVNSKGAGKPDKPEFKEGYTVKKSGARPSPDESVAECKCGIPGCKGHEPDAEGKIHVFHPNGKHYVLDMSKWAAN
jgi:hypothetical protein